MTYRNKTWREKLADKKDLPKLLKFERRFPCYNAVHKMGAEVGDEIVLANPSVVIEFMKKCHMVNLQRLSRFARLLQKDIKSRGAALSQQEFL